jgi:hypothetical protein
VRAVRGLENSIRNGLVGAIYLECCAEHLGRNGSEPAVLLDLLRSFGCQVFWCKERDLAAGLTPNYTEVFPKVGGRAVRLAPIREFPSNLFTDLIAIPDTGPHREILQCF